MNKFPVISAKNFYSLLLQYGCVPIKGSGSHFRAENPKNGKRTTIPVHGNKDISRGYMKVILGQLGIDINDFVSKMI